MTEKIKALRVQLEEAEKRIGFTREILSSMELQTAVMRDNLHAAELAEVGFAKGDKLDITEEFLGICLRRDLWEAEIYVGVKSYDAGDETFFIECTWDSIGGIPLAVVQRMREEYLK